MAAQLRQNRPGLLPGQLLGSGCGSANSSTAAVLVYGNGVCAGDVPQRGAAQAAGKAAQPVSADPASLPPADQPLDAGCCTARDESQPSERLGALPGRSEKDRIEPFA